MMTHGGVPYIKMFIFFIWSKTLFLMLSPYLNTLCTSCEKLDIYATLKIATNLRFD